MDTICHLQIYTELLTQVETITGFTVYHGQIHDCYMYRLIFNYHEDLVDTLKLIIFPEFDIWGKRLH